MRMTRVFPALLVCAVLAGCKEQSPAESASSEAEEDADAWLQRELGWVERTEPAARIAQDRAQKNYRFLSVCSLGCGVVGVSDVTMRMCYPDIDVVVVDKTTEAVQSDRHAELKKKARAFAEDYNRLMEAQLKSAGEGACPPPVNWDGAHTEIAGVLDQLYSGGFRGDIAVSDQRRLFQIRLPRGVTREDVHKPFCDIIGRNGLKDRAGLEVKSVDAQEDYAALAC